jgi:hypothetical protein
MATVGKSAAERVWPRAVVLFGVLLMAALMIRCPLEDLADEPVPPPAAVR